MTEFSDAHEIHLCTLTTKFQLLRDLTTGVAKGFKPGLYVHGPGGLGKSHTVLRQLELLEVAYQLFNSRMTAKGLYVALEFAPDAIHVLEDMEAPDQRRRCPRRAEERALGTAGTRPDRRLDHCHGR